MCIPSAGHQQHLVWCYATTKVPHQQCLRRPLPVTGRHDYGSCTPQQLQTGEDRMLSGADAGGRIAHVCILPARSHLRHSVPCFPLGTTEHRRQPASHDVEAGTQDHANEVVFLRGRAGLSTNAQHVIGFSDNSTPSCRIQSRIQAQWDQQQRLPPNSKCAELREFQRLG